ncbi:hypothetical protein H7169_02945 [Candidatus Gracilibacteria bacterium]|nr:hypothetical protein [Candidatus Gracilibacteria bacterium]
MIVSFPPILGLNIDSIGDKIEALKKFGFLDPIKMIVSLPPILGYNIESIGDKIEALKKFGFLDPVKMIVSFPPILGYNIEKNIKPKLVLLIKMIQKYNLGYTAVSLMESNDLFFCSKRDKIWVLVRILSTKSWDDIKIKARVSQLLSQNLESVVLANIEHPNLKTIKELIQKSKEVKVKYGTEEKKKIISSILSPIAQDKILIRYRRGYDK